MQTVRVRPAPVVLVISKSPAFIRRCGDVTIQVQSVVVEASEQSVATLAAQTRALVVVMLEDTFAQNSERFAAMTSESGTKIVTVPDEDISQSDLEARLLAAITDAQKANRDRRRG
jgi:hypothetical protein